MRRDAAKNLAAAFFNAMHWANQPRALNYRIGAIEGLTKALEDAFPETPLPNWDQPLVATGPPLTQEEVELQKRKRG